MGHGEIAEASVNESMRSKERTRSVPEDNFKDSRADLAKPGFVYESAASAVGDPYKNFDKSGTEL